jgi:L-erythrulose 1-kinase
MTLLFDQPQDFAADALAGFAAAHPDRIVAVPGGVVRRTETPPAQPALVVGGGSGHYPAFAGWVGTGMAHGAVCGNVFASPSTSQICSVARNAASGAGVLLAFGNYAGDVLHFGAAAERLRAEGIDARLLPISDDVASNTPENHRDRRGIAGDLPIVKIIGAALAEGADLDTAERIAWKANDATRSFGIALDGCTLPGAAEPLFHVPAGRMALGLGIHGEPGIDEMPLGTASEVAALLVERVLAEAPARDAAWDGRVTAVLNGLGTVKHEELFLVYGRVAGLLAEQGITIVAPEVGEHVTSLDMSGLSLTLVFLDDELERLWRAPADAPAFRRGSAPAATGPVRSEIEIDEVAAVPPASLESRRAAARIAEILSHLETTAAEHEPEWGRIDAVAGDGDHGQGMAFGTRGAARAAAEAVTAGAGALTVLRRAGASWAESAGGTSGALWGAALSAAGDRLSDSREPSAEEVVRALVAGVEAIERTGGAAVGDKTMIDAAVPFRGTLRAEWDRTADLASALRTAGEAATAAAEATAGIVARRGRSRVLGEKSLGTPDPGAVSFAHLMSTLGDLLVAAPA